MGQLMPNQASTIAVVIPAAGFGTRLGSPIAKQFLVAGGKTVLAHTVDKIHAWAQHYHHNITVMVALSAGSELPADVQGVQTCIGGKERADSVKNALAALVMQGHFDWAMVHDAARPLVRISDIENLYQTLKNDEIGGILAEKVTATVKRASNDDPVPHCQATLPRDNLWLAQTPQLFRFTLLQQALNNESSAMTDEASAIEALGLHPKIIAGSRENIKITTADDWQMVQRHFHQPPCA